jgi:hypothetical protein
MEWDMDGEEFSGYRLKTIRRDSDAEGLKSEGNDRG